MKHLARIVVPAVVLLLTACGSLGSSDEPTATPSPLNPALAPIHMENYTRVDVLPETGTNPYVTTKVDQYGNASLVCAKGYDTIVTALPAVPDGGDEADGTVPGKRSYNGNTVVVWTVPEGLGITFDRERLGNAVIVNDAVSGVVRISNARYDKPVVLVLTKNDYIPDEDFKSVTLCHKPKPVAKPKPSSSKKPPTHK